MLMSNQMQTVLQYRAHPRGNSTDRERGREKRRERGERERGRERGVGVGGRQTDGEWGISRTITRQKAQEHEAEIPDMSHWHNNDNNNVHLS